MNEETIQAARRAWANDPEAAAQALLGCSAEELFITALRGCNQHKHKPGCPDADGGASADGWADKTAEQKLEAVEKSYKKAKANNDHEMAKIHLKRAASYKKKIAGSVKKEVDSMYKEVHDTWLEKGTDFFRKAGVNIADAAAAYSNARGAALHIESSPNSERWPEAKADMQKGFAELQGIYKKLKK